MASLDSLLAGIDLEPLAVRMAATALVVILVSWSAGRFGPIIGGALAGLPITLGPGFFFLIRESSSDFIGQAAAYALLSLCATQLFLLAYIATARKGLPWMSLAAAVVTWVVAASLLRLLPAQPLFGILLFTMVTLLCWRLSRSFTLPAEPGKGRGGMALLLVRGLLAGTLVAAVTTMSAWLGSAGSGLLLAFPIGYTVVSVTLHQTLGTARAISTLRSALLGTGSLAGFCLVLALAVAQWSPPVALAAALATSMIITLSLVVIGHSRPRAG